ncbi:hypothetical protein IYR97_07965 [Pseudomonas fulva]|uniref:Peptidase C39 domain-containing protein n=1 Tax=Pseudomonas fulva TaxID=47880 RepID=A0A7S9LAL5_9PSED|nr:hypothetical protein [Pseudomonas fulva]QPH45541.1 hypothetical protein IYR97_07965 [Pseudomonas fulva]QPH50626.1 hypothetical protein IZU98_07980 [Pseudomonas fulva]
MIKQRSWGDCGVAALANSIRFSPSYEVALEMLGGRDCGITMQEICSAIYEKRDAIPLYLPLDGFGAEANISNAKTSDFKGILRKSIIHGEDRRAILQVKTKSGMLHFIYFDGKKIHDPSPSAPDKLDFSNYESVIDGVFLLDVYHTGGSLSGIPRDDAPQIINTGHPEPR